MPHAPPQLFGYGRGGGLLDDLLVAPLNRALSFPQVDDVSEGVGHDLYFHMAGLFDITFHENPAVAESLFGLLATGSQGGLHLIRAFHDAHALAASARRWLEQNRIADAFGRGESVVFVFQGLGMAGDHRDARPCRQFLGSDLVAHQGDGVGWRADERKACGLKRSCETVVFGQKGHSRDAPHHCLWTMRRKRFYPNPDSSAGRGLCRCKWLRRPFPCGDCGCPRRNRPLLSKPPVACMCG